MKVNIKTTYLRFFKEMDIYGNLFNFTINKQLKFKTNLGAILSLLTLFIIVITCIFFGKDFYSRMNPKVLGQTTVPESYSKTKINNKNLTISWRIEDEFGLPMDFKDIFYPNVWYNPVELNPETKNLDWSEGSQKIPWKRCNETEINENFRNFRNPEYWFCFDLSSRDDIFLGGDWSAQFLYSIAFNINLCQRNEKYERETICSNLNKIKSFFSQRVYISINIPSVYFVFTDYENPLKIEYKNYFNQLNYNLIPYQSCYLNYPMLNDDRGWIFSDYKEYTYISIKNCDRIYGIKFDEEYDNETNDDMLYGIDFFLDKSYPYYIRSYMKFQDLSALVGGFIKIITLIFSFLNFYLNNYERDKFIIDYFFNIIDDSDNEYLKEKYNRNSHISKFSKKLDNTNKNIINKISDQLEINKKYDYAKENQRGKILDIKNSKEQENTNCKSKFTENDEGSRNNILENPFFEKVDIINKSTQNKYSHIIKDYRRNLKNKISYYRFKLHKKSTEDFNSKKNEIGEIKNQKFPRKFKNLKIKNPNLNNSNCLSPHNIDSFSNSKLFYMEGNNSRKLINSNDCISSNKYNNLLDSKNFSSPKFDSINKPDISADEIIYVIGNDDKIVNTMNYKSNKYYNNSTIVDKNNLNCSYPYNNNNDTIINNINNDKYEIEKEKAGIGKNVYKKSKNKLESILTEFNNNIEKHAGGEDILRKRKSIYLLNEDIDKKNTISFFEFFCFKFLDCTKNNRNYKLLKNMSIIKEHITEKFDLLTYYKRHIKMKYLKQIVLSEEQRKALNQICNYKVDYTNICLKPSNNFFFSKVDKNINMIKMNLQQDNQINARIKDLIDKLFYQIKEM